MKNVVNVHIAKPDDMPLLEAIDDAIAQLKIERKDLVADTAQRKEKVDAED